MRWHHYFLFAVVTSFLRAAEPAQPGPEILSIGGAVSWGPLLATLAEKGPIYSTFTEQRWFPFKKIPVTLQGELRYHPDLGLSLRYTTPEDRTLILDQQGLLMRDAQNRQKTAPADTKVPEMVKSLLAVMQFDAQSMMNLFVLRGAREGDDWRLDMEPRTQEQAKSLGWITVFGRGEDVHHLVFKRSSNQRVEIFIKKTQSVAGFTPADRKKYFR